MHRFDAIIVGAGQGGPPLAERLSGAGQTVALIERHRLWRHLRQPRLYSDQDAHRECKGGRDGAQGCRIWRRDFRPAARRYGTGESKDGISGASR
jgi:choline dehydrogenase-like flavoprotein